ncbi:MAG TPA: potassium channel family protein [Thermomicrobiales bacterium]|nr:potassium channel family protein [Thermomicrobiales bacterium]
MIVFLLMFAQVGAGIRRSWKDPSFRGLLAILTMLLTLGSYFYHRTEGWSYIDSLYFCVVAISTVGFGDYAPQTTPGKLFTMAFLLSGTGVYISIVGTVAVNLARADSKIDIRYRFQRNRASDDEGQDEA